MENTNTPALPESVAVAIKEAVPALTSASTDDVQTILYPVREAWIEAIEDGDKVDLEAVCGAFPPFTDDIAKAAEAELDATHCDAIRAMPILLTFVEASPCRVLSGLRALSFAAGKARDDRDRWRHDCAMALCQFLGLTDGPAPQVFDWLLQTMEVAFDDGRRASAIDSDPPPAAPHPVYAARLAAARDAVVERLPNATDLDALADDIRAGFDILHGDAWLAVEEVSRAAAVGGDVHAARLRSEQIVGVHRWFVEHADYLAARGALLVGTMVAADKSRAVLREIAA